MTFTSLSFLFLFLPVVLTMYYVPFGKFDGIKRKVVLVLASLAFYSLDNFAWIGLLLVSILVNYGCVQIGNKYSRLRFLSAAAIIFDVAVLVLFKYINSILGFGFIQTEIVNITFPLGLSYYTFMAISYVADSMKAEKRETSLLETALYMSFFASISAGPITQFDEFSGQFAYKKICTEKILEGSERLAYGFIKKVMVANTLGYLVEECFAMDQMSLCSAWIGGIAYTLQIYFDFSGYSDMAVGVGKMFGFELAENFNYPYAAGSISEFWKRWHMSLTKWFTAYIYIPLGGNRVSTGRHIFNLCAVWVITGLWHGTGWTFLIWAMLHFLVQMAEKYTPIQKLPAAAGHLYTMIVVITGWCIFRADNLYQALEYVKALFGLQVSGLADVRCFEMIRGYAAPLLLGCFFSVPLFPWFCNRKWKNNAVLMVKNVIVILAFAAALIFQVGLYADAPLYVGF